MNVWDVVVLAAVALVAVLAFRGVRQRMKRGCGCGCADCLYAQGCGKRDKRLV